MPDGATRFCTTDNGAMPAAPFIVAALTALTGATFALHMAVAPSPFAASSAAVVALGAVLFSTITVAGLILVRGRWTRRLGIIVAVVELGTVATTDLDTWTPWGWATLGFGLVMLGGLVGRWLDGWVRMRPSATGPDPRAVVLLLGLLALVPAVGLASPGGLETAHGVLGAAGVFLAWAYSKAQVWSLWAIRIALPIVAVPALFVSPLPGAVFLAMLVAGLVVVAWTKEALLAVQPLMDDLPGPRAPVRRSGEDKT